MLLCAIFFLLGDLWAQSFAHLSMMRHVAIFMMFGTSVIFLLWKFYLKRHWHYYRWVFFFVFGFSWTVWYAHQSLKHVLAETLEGQPIKVVGTIVSIPIMNRIQSSFLFVLHDGLLVKLFWRKANFMRLRVGSEWQLCVRLKRIHGLHNPGSLDYEAIAFQKGIRATGYVITSDQNHFITQHRFIRYVDQIRQQLYEKITQYAPATPTAAWLSALMIGEHQAVLSKDWQVLRNTGTNHLMAVAGLHIGLLAMSVSRIVRVLWCMSTRLLCRFPAPLAGFCAGFFAAFFYSLFAGFSIPTERACLMLFLFTQGMLLRRQVSCWHYFGLIVIIVLLINPLDILVDSFCLSFGTIALILYAISGSTYAQNQKWNGVKMQWVISLGLIPLSITLFQQVSVLSLFANVVAVPWLAWVILPLCFLSMMSLFLSSTLSQWLLFFADKSIWVLWQFLTTLSHLSFAVWHHSMPNGFLLFLSIIGILLLLLPKGCKGRWLGLCWLMPLIFYQAPRPEKGEMWLTMLDVGQGLSVVIQTKTHTLLYDTGLKIADTLDSGEQVILPYLRTIGVHRLDMLVVSHGDNDHMGGAASLLNNLPIAAIRTSVPEKFPSPVTMPCFSKQQWEWDGVYFRFLYPRTPEELHLKNNSSCVLRIDNGWHSILLTGDIEKLAEKRLVQKALPDLAADLLVVPHHGSKTSALNSFMTAVHPKIALYGIGYRNRYHFPHPSVQSAYAALHVMQLDTVTHGLIHYRFQLKKTIDAPLLYSDRHHHYWQ